MKITPRNAEAFVRSPDPSLRAVLVYGPDAGLVRERVEALVKAVAEHPADPFRVSELGAREIMEDPARLGDEAAALSLSGGRRAVRLRQAGDDLAPQFKDFFATGRGEALVVVEAGDLPPRSALRKIFEGAEAGVALACYRDDERSLSVLIRETLRSFGLEATPDALAYLGANLEVTIMTEGAGELKAVLGAWRNRLVLEVGQLVDLSWAPDAAVIVKDDEA